MWPHSFQPLFDNKGPGNIEQSAPVVVAASTTTSSATALPVTGDAPAIAIENITNGWAFCNFGDANVGAATLSNGVGVPPGSVRVIELPKTATYVTVILNTAATSGNVRFVRGNGTT